MPDTSTFLAPPGKRLWAGGFDGLTVAVVFLLVAGVAEGLGADLREWYVFGAIFVVYRDSSCEPPSTPATSGTGRPHVQPKRRGVWRLSQKAPERRRCEALSLARTCRPRAKKEDSCGHCSLVCFLSPPAVGQFRNGRGEFFNSETLNGRPILVRFIISDIKPNSCRFEQSFSDDGGKTWEVNWIADASTIEGHLEMIGRHHSGQTIWVEREVEPEY